MPSSCLTETSHTLNGSSLFPLPHPCDHHSAVCFCEFVSYALWKWNHAAWVLLCLAFFTEQNVLNIHSHCCKWQDCLLFHS